MFLSLTRSEDEESDECAGVNLRRTEGNISVLPRQEGNLCIEGKYRGRTMAEKIYLSICTCKRCLL